MHFRIIAGIDFADSFLASDVEKQDFLVCTHTDSKRAISCHLDTVNVPFMPTQICNVDSSLTVPHFDIFIDLTARQ